MRFDVTDMVAWSGAGHVAGPDDVTCEGATADSRAVEAGQLFVGVPGDNVDGGLHAAEAIAKGNGGIPQISVSNYNSLGTRNFRPQFQAPELFQFLDSLSIVRGAHTMRMGFETRQKNNLFQDQIGRAHV